MKQENFNEQLSALLDDELDSRSAISALGRMDKDRDLERQYHRFAVASEIMRSRKAVVPDVDFISRVQSAIAEEPTILAPRAVKHAKREKIVSFALAASVLAVAVLGHSVSRFSNEQAPNLLARAEPVAVSKNDPEFRAYLAMHNETSYLSSSQGMLPSVRLVSGSR